MKQIAEHLWQLRYPLRRFGVDAQRRVAIVRLSSGELAIHSTAPFSGDDVARIKQLGSPRWLLDAMSDHDTFAEQGRAAFPSCAYLAPDGFGDRLGLRTDPLLPRPAAWGDELQVLKLQGVPRFQEHVFFHAPSRALIVCDLLLNFSGARLRWQRWAARLATGSRSGFGVSRRFRHAIDDRDALRRSIETLLRWDFDRVLVGHGDPIATEGKRMAEKAFREAKLL